MTSTRPLTAVLVVVLLAGLLAPVSATAVAGSETPLRTDAPESLDAGPAAVDKYLLEDDALAVSGVTQVAASSGSEMAAVVADSTDGMRSDGVLMGLEGAPTGWVLFAAYSRYDDSDPLENDARNEIYEAIHRSPGTYPVELAETTARSRSTVRYHVRILETEGLVVASKVQGKQRYFPPTTDDFELKAAFNDDATRSVLTAMDRTGAATVTDLADVLDRSASTTSYHLSRLADRGLIEQVREDGAVVNRLAPTTERELRQRAVETTADVAASSSD